MEIDNLVLIHYGSFESIFRKRMCERHGEPPNGSQAAKALDSSVNLLSVIFSQIYLPTYSNWLKEIAGWLGFDGRTWTHLAYSPSSGVTNGNSPKAVR